MRISVKRSEIICYCDGACAGNPGPGGWGAIVWSPDGQVRELGGAENPTTNNRMELQGAIHSLHLVRSQDNLSVHVYTDSSYVVKGISEWVWGWRRRGWVKQDGKPVLNRDLWETLLRLVEARRSTGPVTFHHVRGHAGVPGNERCDRISVAFAQSDRPGLYSGPASEYRIDLTPPDTAPGRDRAPTERTHKSTPHAGAVVYLSLVEGRLERHASWEDCRLRVSGRSGARYKKCRSNEEELQTLAAWGCRGDDGL